MQQMGGSSLGKNNNKKKSIAATQNAKAVYESDNNSIFQRKPACILKIIKWILHNDHE